MLQQVVTRRLTCWLFNHHTVLILEHALLWLAFKYIYSWSRSGQATSWDHRLLNKCNLPTSWKSSTLDLHSYLFYAFHFLILGFPCSIPMTHISSQGPIFWQFLLDLFLWFPLKLLSSLLTLSYKPADPHYFPWFSWLQKGRSPKVEYSAVARGKGDMCETIYIYIFSNIGSLGLSK